MANKLEIRNTKSEILIKSRKILRNLFFNLTSNFSLLTSFFTLSIFYFLLPTSYLYSQAGWGPDLRLTYRPGYSYAPKAACCGDTIHLVWWESYAHNEVFYKRSTDAGLTWGEDVRLSVEDGQSSTLPQIAVSGNTVHVIWFEDDYGILYRRSTDGGTSWEAIDSIIPGMVYSSIQAVGKIVYIAGTIGSLGVLRFTKSYNGGNTWQPIIQITKADAWPRIRVVARDSLILVVTYDNGPSPVCQEIYQVMSYNGGDLWLDSMMISQLDSAGSQHPAMDTDDSGGIHITWYDYKYSPYSWTGDIFYRASRDSGNTWEEIDSLTVMHRAVASDILAEGNNLHLVWEDDRNGFDDNFEIYYRMSTDLGRTWLPEERLTYADNWSCGPSLACDGRYLHLFWVDLRDDPTNRVGEIYYKRKDLSVSIAERNLRPINSAFDIDVFPNPFKEMVTIRYMIPDTRYRIGDFSIKIFDVLGKEVDYEVKRKTVKGETVIIDTKDLPRGVYFVMVRAGGVNLIKKVVKVR